MVTVTIVKSRQTQHLLIEASGHAGGAPAGQNLICAAVSILLWGFASEVAALPPHRFAAGSRVVYGDRPGHCLVDVTCGDRFTYRHLVSALSPMERALDKLAKEHPDSITLSRP